MKRLSPSNILSMLSAEEELDTHKMVVHLPLERASEVWSFLKKTNGIKLEHCTKTRCTAHFFFLIS